MTDDLNIPTYRPGPRLAARVAFVVAVAALIIVAALLVWHRFDNDRSMQTGPVATLTAVTFAPIPTPEHTPAIECDTWGGTVMTCVDGYTGTEYVPASRPTPGPDNAIDPGCQEDEAAVVTPDPDPAHDLTWVCVTLDDWADRASLDRLDTILAERNEGSTP